MRLLFVYLFLVTFVISANLCFSNAQSIIKTTTTTINLWPQNKLQVFVSLKADDLIATNNLLDDLNQRTCVSVHKLGANDRKQIYDLHKTNQQLNYLHLFKSKPQTNNGEPFVGLSLIGCAKRGRQSLVLPDVALINTPQLLKYHLLRSLGVDASKQQLISRADVEIDARKALNQKIKLQTPTTTPIPTLSLPTTTNTKQLLPTLTNSEVLAINELYACPDYRNKLNFRRRLTEEEKSLNSDKQVNNEMNFSAPIKSQSVLNETLESDVESGRVSDYSDENCIESNDGETRANGEQCESEQLNYSERAAQRPLVLQLDDESSRDPSFARANQIKLALVEDPLTSSTLQDYDNVDSSILKSSQTQTRKSLVAPKSEVQISFETSGDKVDGIESVQVLKLCTCTCQAMVPASSPSSKDPSSSSSEQPTSTTKKPTTTTTTKQPQSTSTTTTSTSITPFPPSQETKTFPPWTPYPTWPDSSNWLTTSTERTPFTWTPSTWPLPSDFTFPPFNTQSEITWPPLPPSSSGFPETTTNWSNEYPSPPTTSSTTTTTTTVKPKTTTKEDSSLTPPNNWACDKVEWVKPTRNLYKSGKIVWDVDRGNKNYFICANKVNDELVPGKTNGLSCRVGHEGREYELHNFTVLTKPEDVNLSWIKKDSDSFGKTDFAVVGGMSKSGDLYTVARCVVRDESGELLPLIGYVNSNGNGWFPFDGMQIECDKYDILACAAN